MHYLTKLQGWKLVEIFLDQSTQMTVSFRESGLSTNVHLFNFLAQITVIVKPHYTVDYFLWSQLCWRKRLKKKRQRHSWYKGLLSIFLQFLYPKKYVTLFAPQHPKSFSLFISKRKFDHLTELWIMNKTNPWNCNGPL